MICHDTEPFFVAMWCFKEQWLWVFFFWFLFFYTLFLCSVPPLSVKPTARRPRSHSPPKPSSSPSRGCCRGTSRSSWRAAPTRSSWEPSCTRSGPASKPSGARQLPRSLKPDVLAVFNVSLPTFAERQHHRAAAEGGFCSLRGLVHGRLHPGCREAPSCWEVAQHRQQTQQIVWFDSKNWDVWCHKVTLKCFLLPTKQSRHTPVKAFLFKAHLKLLFHDSFFSTIAICSCMRELVWSV